LVDRNTIVGIDFLVIGLVVLGLGYIGVQSIPIAAFGFAVAIIGALLLLIVPEPIPQDTYRSLLKDAITNIEIILEESQLRERAYFLKIGDEIRAFVPISASLESFQSSRGLVQSLTKGPKRFITNYRGHAGLTLVPPGNELVKLSKVQKGDDVEESLRNVIVGFSDLATSVLSVEEEGSEIKIQIRDPKISSQSPFFNDCLGSPVSCIACCVVSSVKDKPIKIIDEKFDKSLIRLTLKVVE
jgi:hypothetical protein